MNAQQMKQMQAMQNSEKQRMQKEYFWVSRNLDNRRK